MINLYNDGDITHYSMPLENVFLPKVWKELLTSSDFRKRKEESRVYNEKNKYRKRGIAMIPTKFGIAFSARFLNQAGALVHVYTDGSVKISHGGTEMGQGLHTKSNFNTGKSLVVQIASHELGIPISMIHLSETRTDTVANTSPTAASASSDLNGMALVDACKKIMARLEPLKAENPNIAWKDVIMNITF